MERALSELMVGERAVVSGINANAPLHRRLLDIGLVVGTEIKCVMKGPFGDPSAYLIRGTVIAIRSEDGKTIQVKTDGVCGEVRSNESHGKPKVPSK